jgi:HK97 family phage prohead protease
LTPDEKGLRFKSELDVENNAEAKALYSAIQRGDISGMSYAFNVKEEKWLNMDTKTPTREIHKFKKIGEISALWSPAYDETSISARDRELDSSDKLALDNARSTLDNEKNELAVLELRADILSKL